MTVSSSSPSSARAVVRDTTLSQAAVVLTIALDVGGVLDQATLHKLRASITTHIAQHLDSSPQPSAAWSVLLEADANPPKPLLAAGFSVRIRWSQWFFALSPTGAPVRLIVRDDRHHAAPGPATATTHVPALVGISRTSSPVPSLGRSSSCSSIRSLVSTAPTSVSSSESSPKNPFAELGNGVIPLQQQQQRRVRRQRGGVKQKQRGIHIDKAKLDVQPYDNGITGVLTGGVMLGRRPRLAGAPAPF